ncbi:MAG: leucyl/phenylalanyl-tRNA--protein transferase [Steroidobacteraceae bacterium]
MKRITWLAPEGDPDAFPPAEAVLDDPPGLLAAGGDLRPARLIAAYRRGIFPWYSPGQPILWWCPDPREVLLPEEFKRSRSLAKRERNAGFEIRSDSAFEAVIDACAAPRESESGTWITAEMRAAYLALHRLGIAHSIETWQAGQLVGGLYGVQLGAVFFGESMFSRENDASKVALSALVRAALAGGTRLIDCQMRTRHLSSLGSRALARGEFLPIVTRYAAESDRWRAPGTA